MAGNIDAVDACEGMPKGWFIVELIICLAAIAFAFISIALGWASF